MVDIQGGFEPDKWRGSGGSGVATKPIRPIKGLPMAPQKIES